MLLHLCHNFIIATCILGKIINLSYARDMQIFSDFLEHQQLHHGIIVSAPTANVGQKFNLLANDDGLVQIWRQKRLSIYNVAAGGAAFEQQFYFSSPRVGVFVLNALCNLTQRNVFAPASAGSFFNNSQAWLLTVKAKQNGSNELQILRALFESYNINIDADITLAIELKNASVMLYDIYKICHRCGTPLEIVFKGHWHKKSGFVWETAFLQSFVQRRHDFQGLALKSSAVITEKPAHLTNLEHLDNEVDNKQFDFMQRKTFQLLKMMQPMMNFSFDVIFTGFWGQYKNNEWNGIVGDLLHGRAELGVSPVRFAKDRVAAIRYTPELHTEIIRFLFRHPRRTVLRNIFLEPFEMSVWLCVFALIISAIFLLWLLVRQELCCQRRSEQQQRQQHQQQKQQGQHHNQCRQNTTKLRSSTHTIRCQQQPQLPTGQYQATPITTSPSSYNQTTTTLEPRLDFSMLIVLTAIFMQGPSPDAFNLISTRTLITTICVFSVMLLQFYGAFIVGSLLSDTPRSITSMHTLYNSSLDIGMENISYNFEFFINSSNPMARDIYAQRICKNTRRNILAMKQGVERIGHGGFAYHTGVERAYRILQYQLNELEFCELQEVAMEPPFSSSGATSHDSPFREHYANAILRFRLTGLMQYNDKKWQVKKTDCSLVRSTEVEVDIEHFLPALAFLACAMLMTLLILLLELGINFWQKRCKSKIKWWYLK